MPGVPAGPLSGVVLAGGASRRMGRDKASIRIGGERLAERAVRTLRTVCDDVLVASGDGQRLAWVDSPQVADAIPGAGPLAGIVAGLSAARHELVAVLAVDLAFPNADVLRALAAVWSGEVAVVPEVDGRIHPLHAVYARTARGQLRDALHEGRRSVREVVLAAGARVAGPSVWRAADEQCRFVINLNRPSDVETAQPSG